MRSGGLETFPAGLEMRSDGTEMPRNGVESWRRGTKTTRAGVETGRGGTGPCHGATKIRIEKTEIFRRASCGSLRASRDGQAVMSGGLLEQVDLWPP